MGRYLLSYLFLQMSISQASTNSDSLKDDAHSQLGAC